jgi:uncharacterized protein
VSMLAVDTNVLVYAFFNDSPYHEAAKAAVAQLAESSVPWAIPWPCIHEFFAVATNPRLFSDRSLPARAQAQIDGWLGSPSLHLLSETSTHWRTLAGLIDTASLAGPVVHDARIAAICIDHGVTELLTVDRDFSRFAGLRTRSIAPGI